MKYPVVLCVILLLACGCNRDGGMKTLLKEQQALKDSANNIADRIGSYVQKGAHESAELEKKHLGAMHARLAAIQFSIDSLKKEKQ